jgi:hypothetical protein
MVLLNILVIEMDNEVQALRHEVCVIGYELIVVEAFDVGVSPSKDGIILVHLPIVVTMNILDLIQMHH